MQNRTGNNHNKKDKMAKKGNNAATATASPATTESAPKNYTLFNAPKAFNVETAKRRNLPRMIKPGDVPVDGVISGEIIGIENSPVSTIKGFLLHLRHESGEQFLFPCTGVIRQALAPGREKEDAKLKEILEKEIGKSFYAQRKPSVRSEKYKKDMFVFDVFTS